MEIMTKERVDEVFPRIPLVCLESAKTVDVREVVSGSETVIGE